MSSFPNNYLTAPQNGNHGDLVEGHRNKMLSHYFNDGIWVMLYSVSDDGVVHWDSRSSVKMAAKFMKRDTFIQMVIFKKKIHFCENYPCTPVFEGLKSIKKLHDPS